MAIIDGILGLEATIEVDSLVATEYDPPDDESCPATLEQDYYMLSTYRSQASHETRQKHGANYRPHVIKYIEAKPEATFNFCLKRSPIFERAEGASGVYWLIEVDGIKATTCSTSEGDLHLAFQKKVSEIRVKDENGNRIWKRLRFGYLKTDDGDNCTSEELKAHIEKARQLGVLKVFCYHLKGIEDSVEEPSSSERRNTDSNQALTIPEKALKGRSLDCAARLEPTSTQARSTTRCVGLDRRNRPFAVYEFRYRSMEGLIKEGIVPRPRPTAPSKSPSSNEKTRDGAKTRNEQCPTQGNVKDKVIDITKMRVKRERSPFDNDELEIISPRTGRSYKSRRLHDGLLEIDLTEDD